jgi:hypothetical protein
MFFDGKFFTLTFPRRPEAWLVLHKEIFFAHFSLGKFFALEEFLRRNDHRGKILRRENF